MVVRSLPARRQRKYVRAELREGDPRSLYKRLGPADPFAQTTARVAVDSLIGLKKISALPTMAPLFEQRPTLDRAIWGERSKCTSENYVAVQKVLENSGEDADLAALQRMCARGWSAYLALPKLEISSSEDRPLEVLQYWHTASPPSDVEAAMADWKAIADTHRLFNEHSALTFISSYYGDTAVQAFRNCPHPAIQSDYLRLAVLLAEGGTYVDADMAPRPHAREAVASIGERTCIWFGGDRAEGHINNGFLSARPGCGFLHAAFEDATKRLNAGVSRHPYALAGPGVLTNALVGHVRCRGTSNLVGMGSEFARENLLKPIDAACKSSTANWRNWLDATGGRA